MFVRVFVPLDRIGTLPLVVLRGSVMTFVSILVSLSSLLLASPPRCSGGTSKAIRRRSFSHRPLPAHQNRSPQSGGYVRGDIYVE